MAKTLPALLRELTEPDLSAADVALEMSCSLKVVRALANAGKLPGYKVGREWRFKRASLDAFRRPAPTSTPGPVEHTRVAPQRHARELPGWNYFDNH